MIPLNREIKLAAKIRKNGMNTIVYIKIFRESSRKSPQISGKVEGGRNLDKENGGSARNDLKARQINVTREGEREREKGNCVAALNPP